MYVCCSVLAILDVLKYVTQLWKSLFCIVRSKELDILCLHDVGHAQLCVVMYNTHVLTVIIVAIVVLSLCFKVGCTSPTWSW